LISSAVAAMRAMAEMNAQADARSAAMAHSAAMARQQLDPQAAALKTNAQQLGQLSHAMGNLVHDVRKAIASQPPPAIQATLSHPNVALELTFISGEMESEGTMSMSFFPLFALFLC